MKRPEIILILARADNGVIGRNNRLPWQLPADLRRFKALTMGSPMIMGRRTFDSLPGLLDGRRHIVLTRNTDIQEEGAEVVRSIEEAVRVANAPHIAIIGGADIYAQFMPLADRIEMTEVHMDAQGDVFMEAPDKRVWKEDMRQDFPADDAGRPAYSFVTYRRIAG